MNHARQRVIFEDVTRRYGTAVLEKPGQTVRTQIKNSPRNSTRPALIPFAALKRLSTLQLTFRVGPPTMPVLEASHQQPHLVSLVLQSKKALQHGEQLCSKAHALSSASLQSSVDIFALDAKVRWLSDAIVEQLKVRHSGRTWSIMTQGNNPDGIQCCEMHRREALLLEKTGRGTSTCSRGSAVAHIPTSNSHGTCCVSNTQVHWIAYWTLLALKLSHPNFTKVPMTPLYSGANSQTTRVGPNSA